MNKQLVRRLFMAWGTAAAIYLGVVMSIDFIHTSERERRGLSAHGTAYYLSKHKTHYFASAIIALVCFSTGLALREPESTPTKELDSTVEGKE